MILRTVQKNLSLLLLLGVGCQAPATELPSDSPAVAPEPNRDPVLIRADEWTEWHYVGEIMEQCGEPEAAFWKLELDKSEGDK